jgi:hypothetical protein
MDRSFLKGGFQGNTGTGKTMTAALLLLALSIEKHDKAPVAAFDTEPGWQFVKPMFDAEGVDLIIKNGRHFKGLVESLREAKKQGCCGFSVDSLTHPWTELLQRFADKSGRVPMHKFNQIKPMWNEYVVEFMDAPMHCIACGRLQWEMVTMENEDGGYEVVRGDSKMKAGGGESFGYEPHLLVEFTHEQVREKSGKLAGLDHVGFVLKDRARALNGSEIRFKDFRKYEKGMYRDVYASFLPHLEALEIISGAKIGLEDSKTLVPGGDAEFHRKKMKQAELLEEIKNTIEMIYSGRDDASKRARLVLIEDVFGKRSWAWVENQKNDKLQHGLDLLQLYEKAVECLEDLPTDPKAIKETMNGVRITASLGIDPTKKPNGEDGLVVDDKLGRSIITRATELGWTGESVATMLKSRFGIDNPEMVPSALYPKIVEVIEAGE